MKTISSRIDPNSFALRTTSQNLRVSTTKLTSSDRLFKKKNTKWRFLNMTKLTVFTALLRELPVECKEAVLTKPLLKNCTINCLAFEKSARQPYTDNLCLFRALALHLRGKQKLEDETSKKKST